jgi:hypothetical protein
MKKFIGYLPLLLGITISGTNIALESADTTTIGSGFM